MGKLTDVELQALVRKGEPVAGKSDGEGLTFSISKSGPCWDHILATRQVGLYVPGEFQQLPLTRPLAFRQQRQVH